MLPHCALVIAKYFLISFRIGLLDETVPPEFEELRQSLFVMMELLTENVQVKRPWTAITGRRKQVIIKTNLLTKCRRHGDSCFCCPTQNRAWVNVFRYIQNQDVNQPL